MLKIQVKMRGRRKKRDVPRKWVYFLLRCILRLFHSRGVFKPVLYSEPVLQWMEVQSSPENHSLKSSIYQKYDHSYQWRFCFLSGPCIFQKYNHSYQWRFCFLSGPLKYFLVNSLHCWVRWPGFSCLTPVLDRVALCGFLHGPGPPFSHL